MIQALRARAARRRRARARATQEAAQRQHDAWMAFWAAMHEATRKVEDR